MAEQELGEAPPTSHSSSTPVSPSASSPFAPLLPANDAAKKAFHEVARRLVEDKSHTWGRHAAKDICIDIGQYDPKILVNKSKAINELGIVKPVSEMWTGHYQLDLLVPPADPQKGWVIDDGDPHNSLNIPEILLGVGLDFHKTESPLARLVHDYSSGALTIIASADNTIVLDGIEELQGCRRLLHKSVTSIDIGERRYRLELEPVRNSDYRSLLNKYRLDNTEEADQPPSSLVLVPTLSDQLVDRYLVRNPIGVGSTCMVYAGYDRHNGRTIAVKKFRRYNKKTLVRERERIERVNAIGEHPGISRLLDIIDPNDDDPSRGYTSFGVDEVYFIYSPLATCTVAKIVYPSLNKTYVSLKGRLAIFQQLLDGLEFLHRNRIMHRDIKPDNLAVVLPEPPKACFIDFGHSIAAASAADRDVGTPVWSAPEVWALYDRRVQRYYDSKIDIFSLGVSMYQLFCLKTSWWKERVSKKKIAGMQLDLAKVSVHDGLRALLTSCVKWEPQHRPDAAGAQADMANWYQDAVDAEDAYITRLEEERAQYQNAPAVPKAEGSGDGQQRVIERGMRLRDPDNDSGSSDVRGGRHEEETHTAPRENGKSLGRGGTGGSRGGDGEVNRGQATYAQMFRTGTWT